MNYAQLRNDIADFLNRQDLGAVIPTFVRLVEQRLNRVIRTRQMEKRVTANINTQFSTLPTDFLEMRNVQINANPVTALQYVTPQEADRIRARELQGKPRFFSIVADRLELIPAPQEVVVAEMVYYQAIPALSDVNPSNWLLNRHYDIYLYGSLAQAAAYLKDDPSQWVLLYDSAINEIVVDDQRSQFQGTTPQVRGITIG